jgi:hypothetical protein
MSSGTLPSTGQRPGGPGRQGPRGDGRPGHEGAPRTRRQDRWWTQPLVTVAVLGAFIVYGTWAAFRGNNYFADPYLSPFYSPCLTTKCVDDTTPHLLGGWFPLSPALLILPFPLGFRLTCYYYRKSYYRAFWWAPPACAVADVRPKYTGETRFPLILQNLHRYFFYFGVLFGILLTYDALLAFRFEEGFGIGVGTVVLLINAFLIWGYTLSCHSCRHLCGGKLNQFSKHPLRFKLWQRVTLLNRKHPQWAWVSMIWIAFADFYIYLVASGNLTDLKVTF